MEAHDESLVILAAEGVDEQLREVEKRYDVLQVLTRRVLIVRSVATPAGASDPGATGVFVATEASIPESVMATLASTDVDVINAWKLRFAKKQRAGDGLPWDAPGFATPDPKK